jgi:hypothetical protein
MNANGWLVVDICPDSSEVSEPPMDDSKEVSLTSTIVGLDVTIDATPAF